ncbi:MAG: DUF4159 domain-containing protein [Litoreibacter sp.]
MFANLAFTTPLILSLLVILPILWWLLRAVPPAPVRRRFPGIVLLLGLRDEETQADTTPWWLLLLRLAAIAAVIIGFAGPILNPNKDTAGSGPLLVVMDGSWASARDWPARINRVETALAEASRQGRPVAVTVLTKPEEIVFRTADVAIAALPGLMPAAWESADMPVLPDGSFETLWFSDGLDRENRDSMIDLLTDKGDVTVVESARPVFGLTPARFQDGLIAVGAVRASPGDARDVTLLALGPDPNGVEQVLTRATASFALGETNTEILIDLPSELRNRVRRFEIEGVRSAGAVSLTDDALKRREVGLIAGRADQEGQELLSPLHYLRRALAPTADLVDGTLDEMLLANPDVIVLADVATLGEDEASQLTDWVDQGGMLLRFAGPRTAAADLDGSDALMPVRLRAGGRSVGGAMSWGEPKELRAFTRDSPFFGLSIPVDVEVASQVMAEPDPTLAAATIASLKDGTPLVTRNTLGAGQVVLFHVTANAEWSTLPLSGLFVQMLERLAVSTRPEALNAEELTGTRWITEDQLDAFGTVRRTDNLVGVAGEDLVEHALGPDLPPGLYAGEDRRIALNILSADATLTPANWPGSVTVQGLAIVGETLLKPLLLMAAFGLLLIDIIGSLLVAGRLIGPRAASVGVALIAFALPQYADAQDERALEATSEVVLAYVKTGDPQLDQVSEAGLRGISLSLFRRTSVEPSDPIAVDLETDELAFYPMLYWPISAGQSLPSARAYTKLNRYIRTGGLIVFDTRDANIGGFGASTPNGRTLQRIARGLDVPALEPIPDDHVLTRTFYLLRDYPGRYASRDIWVEAAPAGVEDAEGLPFRDLNDGVTPILIGGNDWASAWARDTNGQPMFPVGRGFGGERQRELAIRFGVNLVMHVLTGNYKSDQVHVPALLDRLGN